MAVSLKVLLLEDNPDDAELLLHELRHSGFAPQWQRVDTESDYIDHIHDDIDLILADYSLPNFGALRALRLLQEMDIDVPLIVVTGTVTEQVVVECLRLGASDYLLKDRLTRLGGAVIHALEEKKLRQEKRMADEALRRYAAELEQRVIERTGELQRAKDSVEVIFNNTGDGIILMNIDGNIQRVNPAFEHLVGYRADAIIDRPMPTLAGSEAQHLLADEIEAVRADHQPRRIELDLERQDGTSFVADISLSPTSDQDDLGGIVCSIRDISQRKRVEENLRQALEREKELSDLKSRFTSMVSHEFRTPLAVIQSSSDLLKNYADRMTPDKQSKQLENIQIQVKRLTDLLNDILALGKAQTVGLDYNPTILNVQSFCSDIVTEIRPTATTHEFTFDAQGGCYDTYADSKLLRQAISNLLSNAIKYSPESTTIATRLSCKGNEIVIEIEDHGPGISLEDQEHLFEAFYRAKNTLSVQGTGLGLPIVKQAIEAHGGSIAVDSEVGRGTIFTLYLPIIAVT